MMRPIRSDFTMASIFSGGRRRSFSTAAAFGATTSATFFARATASAWVMVGMGCPLGLCVKDWHDRQSGRVPITDMPAVPLPRLREPGCDLCLDAQIPGHDVAGGVERLDRPVIDDMAVIEDVAALGHSQRGGDVLLHHHDGLALLGKPPAYRQEIAHHDRRQPLERL